MIISRAGTAALALVLLLSLLLPAINIQPVLADASYVVTNTLDTEDPGSLRWAIRSANAAPAGGRYTITFNIPTSDPGYYTENATSHWWRILINDPLPTINRANVYINGSSQPGDTNPGQVGTGGTVGTPGVTLPMYDRPEIEITSQEIAHTSIGFMIAADNVTIRGMAIYSFGGEGASISNAQVRIGSNGTRATIENCLIGVRANGADPGFDSKSAGISVSNMTSGTVKNNYIGNNIMGIYFSNASNWTITGNEIFQNALRYSSYDGMDLASGTNNISVTGNLIRQSGGTGIDSYNGAGRFTISNNTVTRSGAASGNEKCGMRIFGSGSRITGNILTDNGGAGIIVPPLFGTLYSDNNTISQNSCYTNGGLGIDLIRLGSSTDRGDGVNFNDGIFIDTWGNRGIDFPILTTASLAGDNLHLEGYLGTDNTSAIFKNCRLEFFAAATDPTGYGEGRTYLGYYDMLSTNNSFDCNLNVAGKGLAGTESITATATASGSKNDTSEFSLCRQLTVVQNPVLSLHVTPPAYGYAGQSVTYSGSVSNVSTSTAYTNILTWQLPPEFTYLSSSGGTYHPDTRTVTIAVPTINAGQEITGWVTVAISPSVPDGTIVTTGSRLTWENVSGNPLGPVNHSSSIVVYSTPQLTTQLFPPTYAFAGENVIYNGILHNYSSATALNSVLVFQLPAHMSFVSASQAAVVTGNIVTFNLGSIRPGADMSGSMTVHIAEDTPDGTVLQLVTLLSWQDAIGNSYGPQQRYYDLTVYQRPQLTITKDGPPEAIVGSNYTFTGTIANIGSGPAENVTLVDYLPTGMTYVGSSHSAVYNESAGTVTWQLGRISSGNSIPGWISVLISPSTPSGSRLVNNFQATWTDNLSNPYGPVSVSKEITAYSSPQLTITKEGPDEATVGSYITFTGSLSNVGGSPAENTVLVDYLPSGLTYIASSHGATYDSGNRTVTWQIGRLGSGAAMLGWVTVQVDASVTDGARLTNTFRVTWKDGNNNSFGPANADKQVIAHTNPLLSINKTGPVYGRPGGNLTFNINVANFGGLNAQDITLVDMLPDKYSFVSSSPPGTYSGGNVMWNLGSLGPGANTSVSLTVQVAGNTANNTPLSNGAMVTWKDAQGSTYGPSSVSFTTTIYSIPKLIVAKTGPATANPGDNCAYTIAVTNVADHDALSASLFDIVPSSMIYVSSSDSGVYDDTSGMVSWAPVTIAANSSRTVSVILKVDPLLTRDTILTDTAMANWIDEFGNDYGPAAGSCSTSVTPFPTLSISLTGPSVGQVDTPLTFTVGATNNSDTMDASDVSAQFMVPSGCTYVSSSHGGTYVDGTVTWNLASLAAKGSRQVTVVITPTTAPPGSDIISTSAVSWQYSEVPRGPVSASMYTRFPPQLTITKEGPPEAIVGSNYTFTGTIANIGSGSAENVTLVDYLPTGMTYVGSSHSAVYNESAGTVTWQLGRISSGNSIPGWISVLISPSTPNGSRLVNNFQVTWSDNLSHNYGPISASREVTAYSSPQLTITKEGPDQATIGSYITFTGTVTNVGGLPARKTVLVDYLPAGLSFIGSSHSAVYDPLTHTVSWNLGQVDSGVAMPGWITVRVDNSVANGTRLTNSFRVTWEDGSGNPFGPASATKEVIARTNPLLSINKTGPAYGRPGGNLTFNINVANFGGLNAQDITLVDMLPDKYSFVSSSPPGTYSGGNVMWNLGSLGPGANTSVSLTVQVAANTANNTPLSNGAMVTWKDAQGSTYGPSSVSFTTTIYSIPKLIVTKTGPATANPGDNCAYTIAVTNVADHDALSASLFDIVPSSMIYVSSSDGGVYDDATGMVSWAPVTIAANSGRTVSVILKVDPLLTRDTILTDTAMANWQDNQGSYGPATGSCSTSVTPFPELSVLLTGPSSGQVGSALTFTIRVANNSDTMPASNVAAQFIVPSGCSYNSSSDGGTYSGGTVTWSLGTLAALGARQLTVVITPTTAPPGSDVISTSATAWQYQDTSHGPKFATAATSILPAPAPPPPPPPTPEPSPQNQLPVTPRSSGTVNSIPNPGPMQLPYIYIQSAGLSTLSVTPNSPVTVTAVFANKGTVNGSTAVKLYINGYTEAAQGLALASGQSRTVSFEVVKAEPGQYQVYVNGTSAGSFTVEDTYSSDIILTASLTCILAALILGAIMIMRRRQAYY